MLITMRHLLVDQIHTHSSMPVAYTYTDKAVAISARYMLADLQFEQQLSMLKALPFLARPGQDNCTLSTYHV